MISYIRMTSLKAKSGGLQGRVEYICNGERQEEIVLLSKPVDFSQYAEFEKQRDSKNDGRELIIALPNSLYTAYKNSVISENSLRRIIDGVVNVALATEQTKQTGKLPDYQYALHMNKRGKGKNDKNYDNDNFHLHLVFSDRRKIGNDTATKQKLYTKDVYLTSEGKVAVRSQDRATDENGRVKPPIHRKGDIKNIEFSAKDVEYGSKGYLNRTKNAVKNYFLGYNMEYDKDGYFHFYHEGKGNKSVDIKAKNDRLRTVNALHETGGFDFPTKYGDDGKLTDEYKDFLNDVINLDTNIDIIISRHTRKKTAQTAVSAPKNNESDISKIVADTLNGSNIYSYNDDFDINGLVDDYMKQDEQNKKELLKLVETVEKSTDKDGDGRRDDIQVTEFIQSQQQENTVTTETKNDKKNMLDVGGDGLDDRMQSGVSAQQDISKSTNINAEVEEKLGLSPTKKLDYTHNSSMTDEHFRELNKRFSELHTYEYEEIQEFEQADDYDFGG